MILCKIKNMITSWKYILEIKNCNRHFSNYSLRFRKFETSSIWGMQSADAPVSFIIFCNLTINMLQARPGNSSKTFSHTDFQVAISSFVYSIYGIGSPLKLKIGVLLILAVTEGYFLLAKIKNLLLQNDSYCLKLNDTSAIIFLRSR